MQNPILLIATLVLVGLTAPLATTAQDATPAPETQPGSELTLGEQLVDGVVVGTNYTRENYGDWQMRCVVTADGKDPCQLYQLMKNGDGNPVAEFSIFELPANQAAVAGATVSTPLETLLTQQLTIAVDEQNSKRYPFSFCSANGCYARIGLTAEDLATYQHGNLAIVSIFRVVAPDTVVALRLSLAGFTKGFAAIVASNAANNSE